MTEEKGKKISFTEVNMSQVFKDDTSFTPVTLTKIEESIAGKTISQRNNLHLIPGQGKKLAGQASNISAEELEAVKEQAYQQGHQDATTQIEEIVRSASQALLDTCKHLENFHQKQLYENKQNIINLIIVLAKKIIQKELSTQRDIIASTLESVLAKAIVNEEYHITLNPEDLSTAEQIRPELIQSIRGLEHIILKVDPNVTRGGCLLESDTCFVDATIEAQLEAAKDFLLDDNSSPEDAK